MPINKSISLNLSSLKSFDPEQAFTISRGDTLSISLTYADISTSDIATLRLYAKKLYKNGVRKEDNPLFAIEKTSDFSNVFINSSSTAGDSANYLICITLLDASGNTLTVGSTTFELFENGYNGIYVPSEDFRDECLDAKDEAEAAALLATQKATLATEQANNAEGLATSAGNSASTAETFKNSAQGYSESALAYSNSASAAAGAASSYALSASASADMANTYATQSYNNSILPIVTLSATNTTFTLAINKIFVLDTSSSTNTTFTFTLPTVEEGKQNQMLLQLKVGATVPSFSWGATMVFKKNPLIEANSSYNIYFEYDFINTAWTVGSIKKA